jgi:uncharacterized Tic20 family protein
MLMIVFSKAVSDMWRRSPNKNKHRVQGVVDLTTDRLDSLNSCVTITIAIIVVFIVVLCSIIDVIVVVTIGAFIVVAVARVIAIVVVSGYVSLSSPP